MKISVLCLLVLALCQCSHPSKQHHKKHMQARLNAVHHSSHSPVHHSSSMSKGVSHRLRKLKKKESGWISVSNQVCVSATNQQGTLIDIQKSINGIVAIKMTYSSGFVSCDKNNKKNSKFGCKGMGMGILFTLNGEVNVPNFKDSNIKSTRKDKGMDMFWRQGNDNEDSNQIVYTTQRFNLNHLDSFQAFYAEAYKDSTLGDNEGTTCFKVEAKYDESVDQTPENDSQRLGNNICIEGKKKESINLTKLGFDLNNVERFVIKHRSNQIGCYGNGWSNFGCKGHGFGVYIVHSNNFQQVAPKLSQDSNLQCNRNIDGNCIFWKQNGQEDGPRELLKVDNLTIKGTDQLGAIYSEALFQSTTQDNVGRTCFDVWAQLPKNYWKDIEDKKRQEEEEKQRQEEEKKKEEERKKQEEEDKKKQEEEDKKKQEEEERKKKEEEEKNNKNDEKNPTNQNDDDEDSCDQ